MLRILVDDIAPGRPTLGQAELDEENGRGMAIVIALSVAWSIEPLIPGKRVWADLAVDPELTADLPSCSRPTRFDVTVAPDALLEGDVSRRRQLEVGAQPKESIARGPAAGHPAARA